MNDKTYKFHPNDTKMDKKIIQITEKSGFKAAVFSMAAMTMLGSVVISSALPAINRHFEELYNPKWRYSCFKFHISSS